MGLCLDGRISGQNPAFEPNVRIGGDSPRIVKHDYLRGSRSVWLRRVRVAGNLPAIEQNRTCVVQRAGVTSIRGWNFFCVVHN